MTHAMTALSSAALTFFITGSPDDSYRVGAFFITVLAGICACVLHVYENERE